MKEIAIHTSDSPATRGRHYASYAERIGDKLYARYLRPNGWSTQCYYWRSKVALEHAIWTAKDTSLPVTQDEETMLSIH